MVTVCVPFFILIFVLQTRAGMRALRSSGKYFDKQTSHLFGPTERRQLQQHQHPPGGGLDGAQLYPGPDGRRRRRRKGMKRTQSGFQSVTGAVADSERGSRGWWYRFPWRRGKGKEDTKEIIV
jgi:hypothetical protein